MHNDWILDVLADLRSFALLNGLDATANHLADAALVTAAELAQQEQATQVDRAGVHDSRFGTVSGGYPAG